MSIPLLLLEFLMVMAPSVGLGYVWGKGRGEEEGYELGYHEGEFDEKMRGGA